MNDATLFGRLKDDPYKGETDGGTPYSRFVMAVRKKPFGEQKTEWITVIAFGPVSKVADHLRKGNRVLVNGSIGSIYIAESKGQTMGVVADVVTLIDKGKNASGDFIDDHVDRKPKINDDRGGKEWDKDDPFPF